MLQRNVLLQQAKTFYYILSVLKPPVLPQETLQVTFWMWGHRSTRTDSSGFTFIGRAAWVCTVCTVCTWADGRQTIFFAQTHTVPVSCINNTELLKTGHLWLCCSTKAQFFLWWTWSELLRVCHSAAVSLSESLYAWLYTVYFNFFNFKLYTLTLN